ncbi:MAG: redoxin domain-containing protein [Ectothiorhodospiraceae bacterium AqS1]|nr:redoxin domain-containing protein [Ectothiorhodospiraceae bacterium AqS1]
MTTTMTTPMPGQKAPDFSLPNQDGRRVSLGEYSRRTVIVWFFSRAFGSN